LEKKFYIVAALLALTFAPIAWSYAAHYHLSTTSAVSIYLSFLLALGLVLMPGFARETPASTAFSRWFVLLWCSPYLMYAAGTGDFRTVALLKLLAVSVPIWLVYRCFLPADLRLFSWQDALVAVLLVAALMSGQLRRIWNVPANLDFMSRLFLLAIGAWCWMFLRKIPGLGYRFRFSGIVLKQAGVNFLYFAVIAIPLSLTLGFTRWNPRWTGPISFGQSYLEIFFFVALLEETFFRGFLQTLLANTLGRPLVSQAIVACLFGSFHILHAPFPNWRYVGLAAIAGWFYGSAYRLSGSLMASALMHAGVDTVWRTWLSAR
jgi:CAAX protease family protein